MHGKVRIMLPMTDSKSVRQEDVASNIGTVGTTPLFESSATKQLKEIEEHCKKELLDICNSLASERKVQVSTIINMQAITAMVEKLPESEADMLNIPHVTKAVLDRIGRRLLPVTQNYASKRMGKRETFIS